MDQALILRVAKAVNGPRKPVPEGCKFTLDQLRDARWSFLSEQERTQLKQDAIAAIEEMQRT